MSQFLRAKKIVIFAGLISAGFLMGGCVVPVQSKADIEKEKQPISSIVVNENYIVLAHYWDDHAKKQTIDFLSASFLSIREEMGQADITIGNGPYYGMIRLKKISEQSTSVTTYGWGGLSSKMMEWQKLICNYSIAATKVTP